MVEVGSRLAIGTAQFGLAYGIANKTGQVQPAEISQVLQVAREGGIRTIDTAIAYGESETALGKSGIAGWEVISKLPPIPETCRDVRSWVHESVNASLRRLGVPALHGLLLHRGQDLLTSHGHKLHDAIVELRDQQKIGTFGVSIYDPAELNDYSGKFDIRMIQCPLNVFDRRLARDGLLDRLVERGIEIHVRSAFLQGLLLMPPREIPERFAPWKILLREWHDWLATQQISALAACLQFVKGFRQISRIVVGVDSLRQIQEILMAWDASAIDIPATLKSDDPNLINPALWSTL